MRNDTGPAVDLAAGDLFTVRGRQLLQSITDVARAIFGAAASSIFILDDETGELRFEAVSGQGEEFLVGTRFAADTGIAGWVAASGEPLVVDDLATNPMFAHDLAAATRYIPQSLMAAPLIADEAVLGVLEVLDPVPQSRSSLGELDLLALFARQAAVALRVIAECRAARAEMERRPAAALDTVEAHGQLLDAFRDFLRTTSRP
ncbi:GAF domain-containing protein [Phytohabitans sp. ZYX-F-186]|uniref:GAF domain-containing protein n=1 Tax=Phytohabitans maris TaxID=3071409 RepID=A0ABU0ZZC6_9ACTN|nr:GAF domain-containing protein [Phytohabitans sp. ZYX-F-186]MDQ7911317.1 GAF domain-containing protein [Phytohabitans sp. ZYX-F-186]